MPTPTPTPTPTPVPTLEAAFLVAAGDIADCGLEGDSVTAALIEEHPDAVVAPLGDLAYPNGTATTYDNCYDPAWGTFRDRTRPAVGNHDLNADAGAAFWSYFGTDAGAQGDGWYSYDIGAWHAVVLNSNCDRIGCEEGSAQHAWLLADLAAADAACTLAYWHHPRFSSGPHGDDARLTPLWAALVEADAELVLAGHDHLYERFAPLDAAGVPDPEGMRQFTVGTGGAPHYTAERVAPGSELIVDDAHGILRLELAADGYAWSFLTVDGTEADSGSGACLP